MVCDKEDRMKKKWTSEVRFNRKIYGFFSFFRFLHNMYDFMWGEAFLHKVKEFPHRRVQWYTAEVTGVMFYLRDSNRSPTGDRGPLYYAIGLKK
jgi:hypothetical protein